MAQEHRGTQGFNPNPPPNIGAPDDRPAGGGKRGDCPSEEFPIPLAPSTWVSGGYTLEEHPTFWVYVPYPVTPESPAIFSLEDSDGNEVYESAPIDNLLEAGIISITVPSTQDPLVRGDYYDWYFRVYCNDPEMTDLPDQAAGWIQRVTTDTPTDQIWYDTLTDLGTRYRTNPDNRVIANEWATLLRAVGLSEVASKPIAP